MNVAGIMRNVTDFPVDRDRGATPRRVSVTFAVLSVLGSAVLATATAAVTGGMMMGRVEADLASLTTQLDRTALAITAVTNNVNSVGLQTATLAAQVDALRQALVQERADRLDAERRLFDQQRGR